MTDFETHDVGYVAYLKGRIHELEQGACRFNCRLKKQLFIDGFRYGVTRAGRIVGVKESIWDEDDQAVAEAAYKEYLEQKD